MRGRSNLEHVSAEEHLGRSSLSCFEVIDIPYQRERSGHQTQEEDGKKTPLTPQFSAGVQAEFRVHCS